MDADILLVTTEGVSGREVVETLGLVRGASVRAKHVCADVVASFRNLVGGEVREYAALLSDARDRALERMAAEARALGADAVVVVRLQTSTIQFAASEVVAYGTAVRLSPR